MEEFYKAKGYGKSEIKKQLEKLGHIVEEKGLFGNEDDELDIEADLAWQVRAWGQWVLDNARKELASYYPTYADFEPIMKDQVSYEKQPMKLVPLKEDGTRDIDKLNSEFTKDYLDDKRNPRWIEKPTLAYLWARTVKCKNCRAEVPLLKTRWLCKKGNRRVLLSMEPENDKTRVVFGVKNDVPVKGGNAAQRREHDKRISEGTMSRSGVKCPCCATIMTSSDIRLSGQSSEIQEALVAVVIDGSKKKEYRPPSRDELELTRKSYREDDIYCNFPHGKINEPTPKGGGRGASRAFSIQNYGLMTWGDLFTERQRTSLGKFMAYSVKSKKALQMHSYDKVWTEAIVGYLAAILDFVINRNSILCTWTISRETTRSTFARFALPFTWDFSEVCPLSEGSGSYSGAIDWIARYIEHTSSFSSHSKKPVILQKSAINVTDKIYDIIVTDPPYYDAIPYSDLMDYFYVWLKRSLYGLSEEYSKKFKEELSPKWNEEENDGELIDDDARHGGDSLKSKKMYEDGMYRSFQACHKSLSEDGRFVIVFAHKDPDAWETLASAIIRAGFVVDGSWPIQTEMSNRTRALVGAALASSIWLVCKKREVTARPGWDNKVLEEMQGNIHEQLREFWDAGIRGPDFVWAATGPALEAYSKHPVVKKANDPGEVMTITEFLNNVRRIVVDFVVGRVLTGDGDDGSLAHELDGVTSYYLLHRYDFGFNEAPIGACILYAVSCGLSDHELASTWNILVKSGLSNTAVEEEDIDPDSDAEVDGSGSGSKVKLRTWKQRKAKSMGFEAPGGRPVPTIDRIHRLMHLWKDGDVTKVDEYLDDNGLRRNELFSRVLQSLIELCDADTDERSILESISNHSYGKGAKDSRQKVMADSEGKSIA